MKLEKRFVIGDVIVQSVGTTIDDIVVYANRDINEVNEDVTLYFIDSDDNLITTLRIAAACSHDRGYLCNVKFTSHVTTVRGNHG